MENSRWFEHTIYAQTDKWQLIVIIIEFNSGDMILMHVMVLVPLLMLLPLLLF